MSAFDHLLFLVLAVVWPVWSHRTWPGYVRDVGSGRPGARMRGYLETYAIEWTLFVACLASWSAADRPLAGLGIALPATAAFKVGAALTLAACLAALWHMRRHRTLSEDEAASARARFEDVLVLLPHTPRERVAALGLAFTAGVCEELLFRGFLLAYLDAYLPWLAAVLGSAVIFGLAHAYQGAGGALRCGMIGLVTALLYVWTGSILLPALLHVVVDVHGLEIGHAVVRAERASPQGTPSS